MMFTNERYVTKEVADIVPIDIQLLIWKLIEVLEVNKDYLQVFEIIPIENDFVKIIQKQEIPEFTCEIIINNKTIKVIMKIFVIDNIEYSIMMFNTQY